MSSSQRFIAPSGLLGQEPINDGEAGIPFLRRRKPVEIAMGRDSCAARPDIVAQAQQNALEVRRHADELRARAAVLRDEARRFRAWRR